MEKLLLISCKYMHKLIHKYVGPEVICEPPAEKFIIASTSKPSACITKIYPVRIGECLYWS